MSTMKELVQIAQDRKYSEFETKAREALTAKFMGSKVLQDSLTKLAVAKGQIVESDEDKDDDSKGSKNDIDKGEDEDDSKGSEDDIDKDEGKDDE